MPGIPSFPRSLTVLTEHPVPGGRRLRVDLAVAGAAVPGLLLLPERAGAGRAAAALLLHGYASRKELMAETIGTSLLAQGMASLAIDLPLHGERDAPIQEQAMRNPLELMRQKVATQRIFTIVMSSIASISLLIGGTKELPAR